MSEYHDRYTVARLIGAAPGLIGYEEGGMSPPFIYTLSTHQPCQVN